MEFNLDDFTESKDSIEQFNLSDFGLEEDAQAEEDYKQTIEDDVSSKKNKALDLSFEQKKNALNELDVDDTEKEAMIANLEASHAEKKQKIQDETIARLKPVPEADNQDVKKEDDKNFTDVFLNFLNDAEDAILQPFDPAIDLAVHMARKAGNAMGMTGEKALNYLFNTDFDFYDNQKDRLEQRGVELNNKFDPNNNLALSPVKMTELFASIAVPLGVTNPKKMLALEGLIGYTLEMSDSGDFFESVKGGVVQAGAAAAGVVAAEKLIKVFSKKGTGDALEHLWKENEDILRQSTDLPENASKQQVIDAIEEDWLSIMSGSSSNENKVRAMIDRLGQRGAEYKQAVQEVVDKDLEKIVRQPKSSRVEDVRMRTEGGSIEEAGEELGKQVGVGELKASKTVDDILAKRTGVSEEAANRFRAMAEEKLKNGVVAETYNSFADAMKSKYRGEYSIEGTSLESVKNALEKRATLSKGLQGSELNLAENLSQPMTMDNILSIKRDINDLIRNSSGVVKTNARTLKTKLNQIIKLNLDEADVELMNKLDKEWANKRKIDGTKDLNKIGVELMSMVNKKLTNKSVISNLEALNEGEASFKQLEKVIGTKNIAKLEKGIVKSLISGDIDSVSYDVINKSLNKMGFVSKEGKELKKIIDKFDTVFKSDNFTGINKIAFKGEKDAVALTANLAEKVKYSVSSSIFKKLKKLFLSTKEAEELRNLEQLADILTEKKLYTNSKFGKVIPEDEFESIVRQSIIDAYKAQIKTIMVEGESIPEDEIVKATNNSMADLGFSSNYGGKATRQTRRQESIYEDYTDSLFGTKKEQEVFKKEINRLGIRGVDSRVKAKNNYEKGAREWYSSLTNKQKEEVVGIIEAKKDKSGGYSLTDAYEEGLTKYNNNNKASKPSYKDISDSMFGTKEATPKDTSGNLGMTSSYGGKATGTGGVNTNEARQYLNRFMDDIANPKVSVKTEKVDELFGMLKAEGTTMPNATPAKEKAWNEAMDIVNEVRKSKSVSPKAREQMIRAVKRYYDLLEDTI